MNFPKIELHCHLDGSLSIRLIKKLLYNTGISANSSLIKQIQVSDNCKSLAEYLEKFDLPLQLLQTKENIKMAVYDVLQQASDENIKYIEIRFAPMLSCKLDLSNYDVVLAAINGLNNGKKDFNIEANLILCGMRNFSVSDNINMYKETKDFLNYGVCGYDLAGDENKFPNNVHLDFLKILKNDNINFTIHSGETGNIDNIKIAIEYGCKRIGHGIALKQDLELIKKCVHQNIGIEMCPTSNIQTKAISDFAHYPINFFLQNNINVSLNTDNRTVSNTNLTKEFKIIKDTFYSNDMDFYKKIYINSLETAFCHDFIKEKLFKLI